MRVIRICECHREVPIGQPKGLWMYLCVCQEIREGCLTEIGKRGIRLRRARELFVALGKAPQCGVCLRHIQGRLDALAHGENGLAAAADAAARGDGGRCGLPVAKLEPTAVSRRPTRRVHTG